ncbi:MAG: S8 family serine peptidase [Synergistaceae bacterium]|jgi:subtilisin family serine protease|nr:S8 family serine peptidase [Synergistaceae bacterium]
MTIMALTRAAPAGRFTVFSRACALAFLLLAGAAGAGAAAPIRAQYIEGEALVLLKNDGVRSAAASAEAASARAASVAEASGARLERVYEALSAHSGYVFAFVRSDSKTTEQLIADLKSDPRVLSASPNRVYRAFKAPNDPAFTEGKMWGLEKIGAPEAWDKTTGSSGVSVAVVDSGISSKHQDLAANVDLENSRNFTDELSFEDENGHGTHVSGTIAAVGNNNLGVTGVNWNAKVIAVKVLDGESLGNDEQTIAGIDYVLKLVKEGKHVAALNLSLGGFSEETPDEKRAENDAEYAALKTLSDTNKVVIVVAAGNYGLKVGAPAPEGHPHEGEYAYPASYTGIENMIVVSALDSADEASIWAPETVNNDGKVEWIATNWSPTRVDLAAPGSDILSTISGDKYDFDNGTSMAAPHVTGAVALLAAINLERGLGKTANELKQILLDTADNNINPVLVLSTDYRGSGNPYPNKQISKYGLLNVNAAVNKLTRGGGGGCDVGLAGFLALAAAALYAVRRAKR